MTTFFGGGSSTFDVALWAMSFTTTVAIESAVVRATRPRTDTWGVLPAIAFLNLVTHPAAWWSAASGIPWTLIEVVATAVECVLWRRFSDWTWTRCLIVISVANTASAVASFFIPAILRG